MFKDMAKHAAIKLVGGAAAVLGAELMRVYLAKRKEAKAAEKKEAANKPEAQKQSGTSDKDVDRINKNLKDVKEAKAKQDQKKGAGIFKMKIVKEEASEQAPKKKESFVPFSQVGNESVFYFRGAIFKKVSSSAAVEWDSRAKRFSKNIPVLVSFAELALVEIADVAVPEDLNVITGIENTIMVFSDVAPFDTFLDIENGDAIYRKKTDSTAMQVYPHRAEPHERSFDLNKKVWLIQVQPEPEQVDTNVAN